jgi:hypothetical protein
VYLRVFKEHNLYLKEAEDNTRKLEKFKADGVGNGVEEWDIKNAVCIFHFPTQIYLKKLSCMRRLKSWKNPER